MAGARRADAQALLALAITIALWGSAFAAIRAALRGLTPEALSLIRLATASAALALVALWRRPRRPARHDWPRIAAVALTGMTLYQLLLNSGEVRVPAGPASILVNMSPIFTALLATAIFGERLNAAGWLGIAVSFAGASLIGLAAGSGVRFHAAALTVLAAATVQAAFFLLQKPLLARYTSFDLTCWAMWLGTALLVPISLPAVISGQPTAQSLAAALYLGLGPSAFGFVSWAYAVGRIDVSLAASTLYLTPLFAFLPAWLLLGERLMPVAVAGGTVLIGGLAIVAASRRQIGLATDRAQGREGCELHP
jgi:drug/metabolite transporter (DMT)-like permease